MTEAYYKLILNNNQNIKFTVDSSGTIFIDKLSLKDPEFSTFSLTGGALSIDQSGNLDTSGNVTIKGNLEVTGSRTDILTTNKYIKDSIIELGRDTSGNPSNDAGLIIERGNETNITYSWIENIDAFVLGLTSSDSSDTNITIDQPYIQFYDDDMILGKVNTDYYIKSNGIAKIIAETNQLDLSTNTITFGKPNNTNETELKTNNVNSNFKFSNNGKKTVTFDTSGLDDSANIKFSFDNFK